MTDENEILHSPRSCLSEGNDNLCMGNYIEAITCYENALATADPSLRKVIKFNIELAKKKIRRDEDVSGIVEYPATREEGLSNTTDNNYLKVSSRLPQSCCRLKIAVVLHVSQLGGLSTLIDKICNITAKYDLFVTVPQDKKQKLEKILSSRGMTGKIIGVNNADYDILPFIQCLSLLIEEDYDLVCKLHTLKDLTSIESQYFDNAAVWLDMLLNPILGNSEVVRKIIIAFAQHKEIGMIGSADFYNSVKTSMEGNETYVSSLLQSLSPKRDTGIDWGFFVGNIFWSRVSILKPLLSLLPTIQPATIKKTAFRKSMWHAMDRMFGILPEISAKEIVLAYSLDNAGEQIRLIQARYTNIPNGGKYSIETHIKGFIHLNENVRFLRTQSSFSSRYYLSQYASVVKAGFEPAYHYLRYGVYERCNPNSRFSSTYYWEENRDVLDAGHNPFVHYLQQGMKDGRAVFPAEENAELIFAAIKGVSIFDSEYSIKEQLDVFPPPEKQPLQHCIQYGWQDNYQPVSSLIFDALWYSDEYLRHWRYPINPLLHYAVCRGRRKLLPRPGLPLLNKVDKPSLTLDNPKRICLFAGYDPQGIIDDYVIDFISELQKYADVYYLADGNLQFGELEKLEGLTKGAWAFRHGEYDFGSYSRLARDLVGWEHIRNYDELLLINDSCYLVDSLEKVFLKMKHMQCDWWGLQATKGISATQKAPSNQFSEKIPIDIVLERMLPEFEADECYDFLIGSYFLAFRQQVLKEGGELHELLDGVQKEKNKKNVILRYEIGLTRRLLLAGFKPATFIDSLYPFHPIYSRQHFDLIREGFPLFKRFLLTENHYQVPELWRWKAWIKEILPSANLSAAETNLCRIGNADKLYNTMNIPESGAQWPPPPLSDEQFKFEDTNATISDFCWAFPVCGYDHQLGGNERMVFEYVKNNPRIRKIILTRSKCVQLEGVNLQILPLKSLEGQRALMNARYIFIKHTPRRNVIYPLDSQRHRFINLWHGIPLKRIGYASLDMNEKLEAIAAEHSKCHAVIASSPVDRLAMTAAFYPLTFNDIWITGLPRNDVILRKESLLPKDFRVQLDHLHHLLRGRRLVLFAPTFRNTQADGCYSFSDIETKALADCLLANNSVLGIREHMADKDHSYSVKLVRPDQPFISLDRIHFPDIELLYRKASLLITDYSSCFIDFMITGKPEICFAYDLESYSECERGFFYNLDDVFPGPICREFGELISALHEVLSGNDGTQDVEYRFKRSLFFSHYDENNTRRLVNKIFGEIEDFPSSCRGIISGRSV